MQSAIKVHGFRLGAPTRSPSLGLRLLSIPLAVLAISCGCAQAADMPLETPPPPLVFSWTGPYLGLYVGGAASRNYTTPDAICQFGGFFAQAGRAATTNPCIRAPAQHPPSTI